MNGKWIQFNYIMNYEFNYIALRSGLTRHVLEAALQGVTMYLGIIWKIGFIGNTHNILLVKLRVAVIVAHPITCIRSHMSFRIWKPVFMMLTYYSISILYLRISGKIGLSEKASLTDLDENFSITGIIGANENIANTGNGNISGIRRNYRSN